MDNAKKQAGPVDSLSAAEKQANKKRTNAIRRRYSFDESYLNPAGKKSALVRVEHPEDLASMAHMRQGENW